MRPRCPITGRGKGLSVGRLDFKFRARLGAASDYFIHFIKKAGLVRDRHTGIRRAADSEHSVNIGGGLNFILNHFQWNKSSDHLKWLVGKRWTSQDHPCWSKNVFLPKKSRTCSG